MNIEVTQKIRRSNAEDLDMNRIWPRRAGANLGVDLIRRLADGNGVLSLGRGKKMGRRLEKS